MSQGQRVLVVDGLSDIQEVLEAILAPRGLRVDRARLEPHSENAGDSGNPDIVVIDAEATPVQPETASRWEHVPHVIIGGRVKQSVGDLSLHRQYLNKPFQYAELVHAIERMLPESPSETPIPGTTCAE